MSNQVLPPQTGAAQVFVQVFPGHNDGVAPVTVAASGLAGAEAIAIEFLCDTTPVPTGTSLTADEPVKVIVGPGTYRLDKPATAAATGIYMSGTSDSRVHVQAA